jgi:hypothetical protein
MKRMNKGMMKRTELMRKQERKKLRKFGLFLQGLLLLLHPRGEERMLVIFLSHLAPRKNSIRKSRSSHGLRGLCFAWKWILAKSNTTSTFRTSISLTIKA